MENPRDWLYGVWGLGQGFVFPWTVLFLTSRGHLSAVQAGTAMAILGAFGAASALCLAWAVACPKVTKIVSTLGEAPDEERPSSIQDFNLRPSRTVYLRSFHRS
ncbi:hypothetical protein [Sulfobacillus harzensis]|uniref:Uncharacterized protein n=1 Tax=Sulfobacillus harzensis TaxID=2729629 RepID=A0A7Y0Q383_9FIRM|nr:hypothetical protein [Sulfobacillus harzensis]NMP23135.1 hypothetical protein [Sulfobacillus harzensis]